MQSNHHVISFRVNAEERDALLRQAKKCGVNLSLLIRNKLDMSGQGGGLEMTSARVERALCRR